MRWTFAVSQISFQRLIECIEHMKCLQWPPRKDFSSWHLNSLVPLSHYAIDKAPGVFCKRKNPFVYEAINKFCSKTNLVVGSTYSRNGVKSNNRLATVRINGDCKPAQWVPQSKQQDEKGGASADGCFVIEYCKSQFMELCARGDSNGANGARYGRNACQVSEVEGVFGA
ncbi:hypothetical protein HII31_01416 [Pseudocercospora fuligena]|uniref:Uncharacterized protein n=1 Tax=Pseudocercospora fuligena TaxID=685502 RepID=A0A8H6RU89_9PEZI|nr:hypothetical protein HII31_01416 [Pseudocercospora fuligena]